MFVITENIMKRPVLGISPYRAVNTFHHGYKNQPVNDV